MTQKSSPRVALITGAAKRIGAGITQYLHAQGWNVIIHYHQSSKEATALAQKLNKIRPHSAHSVQADLAQPQDYALLVQAAAKISGRLDALINNASTFFPNKIGKTSLDDWNEVWNTNVTAPFFLSQEAVPFLKKTNGCIINITDTHADGRPIKNYSAYSISKAALLMQTQSIARELAPHIRVNAIAPGVSLWNTRGNTKKKLTAQQKEILNRTPLQRAGDAEEIAKAVGYLLNDASYTTGSVIYVDGGRCVFN